MIRLNKITVEHSHDCDRTDLINCGCSKNEIIFSDREFKDQKELNTYRKELIAEKKISKIYFQYTES